MTKTETYTDGPFTITIQRKRMGRPPKAKRTVSKEAFVGAQDLYFRAVPNGLMAKRRGRTRKRA